MTLRRRDLKRDTAAAAGHAVRTAPS